MARNYGFEYKVSAYCYLKVAMAKRKDQEEIEEESFDATCRLYEHETNVEVIDNRVVEVNQDNKYFTVADVGLELRVKVRAHDYEKAYAEAEKVAEEVKDRLPAGVAFYGFSAFEYEKGEPAVDWDVA